MNQGPIIWSYSDSLAMGYGFAQIRITTWGAGIKNRSNWQAGSEDNCR